MKEAYSEEEKNAEKTIMQELMQWKKQEEILWQQKSQKLWLREGDRNTRFFHKSTIQNRQHNQISQLKSSNGQLIEKQSDFKQQLVQFYSKLLNEIDVEGGI